MRGCEFGLESEPRSCVENALGVGQPEKFGLGVRAVPPSLNGFNIDTAGSEFSGDELLPRSGVMAGMADDTDALESWPPTLPLL